MPPCPLPGPAVARPSIPRRRTAAKVCRLAFALMVGNSGGIVGHVTLCLLRRAGFRLRLAAPEIFAQRFPQALVLASLLRAVSAGVHDDCWRLACVSALWQGSPQWRPCLFLQFCCRSSVVEHSLGKGEVDSSILSGST